MYSNTSVQKAFRPHLVRGMDIPLKKWIVITENEEEYNGIIILIP
jgi:hypothetical protein